MAKSDNDNEESLTPEQRLDLLEKKTGSNKLMLLILALCLVIAITVSVTIAVVGVLGGSDQEFASQQDFVELSQRLDKVSEQLLSVDTRLAQLKGDLAQQNEKISSSGNQIVQGNMIEQERNYQSFLETLRSAVYDLANMVPGSRAWLELYSEQIDEARASSESRQRRLQNMEPAPVNDDSFF